MWVVDSISLYRHLANVGTPSCSELVDLSYSQRYVYRLVVLKADWQWLHAVLASLGPEMSQLRHLNVMYHSRAISVIHPHFVPEKHQGELSDH